MINLLQSLQCPMLVVLLSLFKMLILMLILE